MKLTILEGRTKVHIISHHVDYTEAVTLCGILTSELRDDWVYNSEEIALYPTCKRCLKFGGFNESRTASR